MEVSGELNVLAALAPGQALRYPWNGMLNGSQSQSGRFGEDRLLDPARIRTRYV